MNIFQDIEGGGVKSFLLYKSHTKNDEKGEEWGGGDREWNPGVLTCTLGSADAKAILL